MELNGRKILIKSLFGSENYNLNTTKENNTYLKPSDKDYKIFVMPVFDDLYKEKGFILNSVTEKEDFFAMDIRRFPGILYKSSLNAVELLYSRDIFIQDGGYSRLKEFLELKDDIAKMNLASLFGTCKGSYYSNLKDLTKATSSTQYLVDKFEYNTKRALVAYRAIDFIIRFYNTGFNDFKSAMTYNNEEREFLLSIKNGRYTIDEFKRMIETKFTSGFMKLEEEYCKYKANNELSEHLHSIVKDVVYKNREECLKVVF